MSKCKVEGCESRLELDVGEPLCFDHEEAYCNSSEYGRLLEIKLENRNLPPKGAARKALCLVDWLDRMAAERRNSPPAANPTPKDP